MTGKDELFGMTASDFRNVAYKAILQECEHIEHIGKYKGNGHHLAQRLADMVSDELIKGHTEKGKNPVQQQNNEHFDHIVSTPYGRNVSSH